MVLSVLVLVPILGFLVGVWVAISLSVTVLANCIDGATVMVTVAFCCTPVLEERLVKAATGVPSLEDGAKILSDIRRIEVARKAYRW